MSIHSGLTPSMTQEIQKIYDAETKHLDFMSWDGFFDAMEQLSKASPDKQLDMLGSLLIFPKAPAYRYLTYALLELSEMGVGLKREQFRETTKQIFTQAEATQNARTTTERYQQDLLHSLTDSVFEELVHRGFAANPKKTRIHASLWDEKKTLTRKDLCKTLFSAQSMTREAFLTLSLGLAFDVSFVQDYLKRVLRERELDIWDSKEALVFVLLQQPNLPNPYADYRKLLDTYNSLSSESVHFDIYLQQTQEIQSIAEQMIKSLALSSVSPNSPKLETLLAQHKYLVEQQENRRKNDIDEWRAERGTLSKALSKEKARLANDIKNWEAAHGALSKEEKRDMEEDEKKAIAEYNYKQAKAASHKHLHTPDRLFCELRDSVGEKLKNFELPAASTYTTDAQIQAGTLGKQLYGFPYEKEQLFDQEHPVSHEELIKFVRLLAPILDGKWLNPSRMTHISQGTEQVRRDELMTMAFLDRAMYLEGGEEHGDVVKPKILNKQPEDEADDWSIEFELDSFINHMNSFLQQAGFDPLYCMNPYDVLLMYLSLLEKPYSAYRYIFSLFMDMKKKKEIDA